MPARSGDGEVTVPGKRYGKAKQAAAILGVATAAFATTAAAVSASTASCDAGAIRPPGASDLGANIVARTVPVSVLSHHNPAQQRPRIRLPSFITITAPSIPSSSSV